MLTQVANGVLVHESTFIQSNAVIVDGSTGVLLIDPGISGEELDDLAADLSASGRTVITGFATHPHWDHMLWHVDFGDAPRYATDPAASWARERLSGDIQTIAKAVGIPENVPLELMGKIAGLTFEATEIPWAGPRARILEHRAHAPGHAAVLLEESRVLVAGDMLSDVLIPMLDLNGAADPLGDYLAALELLETVAGEVDVVIPGHGSVGSSDDLHRRLDQDRAYITALRNGDSPADARIGRDAKPGWEWVAGVHDRQIASLAS